MTGARYDTLIRGATVVMPTSEASVDIAIADGRIAALLPRGAAASASEIVEASGLHVLPGAIDIHFHVRAPAFPERASVGSETRAAAAGGVTTLFEMPLSKPCCASADQLAMRREHFAGRAFVNFALYGAPGDRSAAGMRAMADEGAIGFKMFTTPAPPGRSDEFDGLAFPDEAEQMEALTQAARLGLPVVVHAESAGLLAWYEARAAALPRASATTHGASRPDVVEAVAVAKLLGMNVTAQARLHIAHVTSSATVDVLRRFAGSSDFSAETCPQYLFRTERDVARVGVFGKVNPPIRHQADQDALWSAIADGTITHVTTDHTPFALTEKQAFADDFPGAPPGTPGVEVMLPALLDAVDRGRLPLSQAVALVSANAARRFGLQGKGNVTAGADADLVLVDLRKRTVIQRDGLLTQARDVSHLYEGMSFTGHVVSTFVAGRQVYGDGEIQGDAASGRFVRPSMVRASATASPLRSAR